ncbi:hypothetical protein ANO14919_028150 [Xylariales sp. No.14919]|nr:hypothetical protein ANO14919_028150 [Xylariales sp. No.14919]
MYQASRFIDSRGRAATEGLRMDSSENNTAAAVRPLSTDLDRLQGDSAS